MAKFNFANELAKALALKPDRKGQEELSTEIHETFSLPEADEKRASVFAYLEMLSNQPDKATDEEMEAYGIDSEDIRKYRKEWEESA